MTLGWHVSRRQSIARARFGPKAAAARNAVGIDTGRAIKGKGGIASIRCAVVHCRRRPMQPGIPLGPDHRAGNRWDSGRERDELSVHQVVALQRQRPRKAMMDLRITGKIQVVARADQPADNTFRADQQVVGQTAGGLIGQLPHLVQTRCQELAKIDPIFWALEGNQKDQGRWREPSPRKKDRIGKALSQNDRQTKPARENQCHSDFWQTQGVTKRVKAQSLEWPFIS